MRSFKSFQQELFRVNNQNFNDFALNLFLYQAKNNPVYAHYLSALDIEPKQVKTIEQIPCLPVSFFKRHRITTESWKEKIVYESSGTTGLNVSRHYVREEKFYLENCEKTFAHFYGPLWNYHMLFLLPGYMERGNSSLVSMANYFAKCTKSSYSGFYLHNYDDLLKTIDKIKKRKDSRKVVLCGVSFALMDLAENYEIDLSENVIVMETGGMKGRRKELVREELHAFLSKKLNLSKVHSEYGMTELSSQAYSSGFGKFKTPPWMKVVLRDTNDPFATESRQSGGINVIDLANISSCAFIETQDLGTLNSAGELDILGRFDNADIRGCNLLI